MNLSLDNKPILIQAGSDFFLSKYTQDIIKKAKSSGYILPSNIPALDEFLRMVEPQLAKLDVFYVFTGDGSPHFKLLNVANPSNYEAEAFGGLDWRNEGVKGNGTNGYINTKFNAALAVNSKFNLNDACYGTVLSSPVLETRIDGNDSAFSDRIDLEHNSRINSGPTGTFPAYSMDEGLKYIGRNTSDTVIGYDNNSILTSLARSASLFNGDKLLLARLISVGQMRYSTNTIALYFMGAHLTLEDTQNIKKHFDKYLIKVK